MATAAFAMFRFVTGHKYSISQFSCVQLQFQNDCRVRREEKRIGGEGGVGGVLEPKNGHQWVYQPFAVVVAVVISCWHRELQSQSID